ncbi:hypothetical protein JCM11641_006887 [Rhodosporidiobolus odoratus]
MRQRRATPLAIVALALAWCLPTLAAASNFTNNWAVLVCTSRFWFNYRHMSNTLAMYRTVKRLGIPDSQIILMLADDAACNPRNPFAGSVYSNADRKTDLYGDKIEVDYKGEEVSVETFLRLLSGRLPESTPASKRLMTDENSNIFVYMTGHGGDEFLKFQDNEEISAFDIADAFGGMWAKKRYNEILFMVDTCQANTLYTKFYSPNILATGSSEKDQNSYSHHADNDIGVAVVDRYSHHVLTFLEGINKTSKVPVQNLFDTFSHEIIHSTPGVRSDLFNRPLSETLLTDFFGGVSEVELTEEREDAQEVVKPVGVEEVAVEEKKVGGRRRRRRVVEEVLKVEEKRAKKPDPLVIVAGSIVAVVGGFASTSRLTRTFSTTSALSSSVAGIARPARPKPKNEIPPLLRHAVKPPAGQPDTELFEALRKTPGIRARPTLVNEEAAREVVRAWGVDRMQDVVVVDAWAGPGGLTRAYLELPNVKKVIAIEEAHRYSPMLDTLKERHGDRFERVTAESFLWESYTEAEEHFKDIVPKHPFSNVHPSLFFSAQLPNNTYGNLMFFQLVAAAAGQMWYHQYGRLQMGFLAADTFWNKIFASPGEAAHHKLSVLIPAVAHLSRVQTLGGLRPPELNFHKPRGDPGLFGAVKAVPRVTPLVKNYDALEFVARNMFVTKANTWPKALASAAPGAVNLVDKAVAAGLTDLKKTVNQLSLEEWVILADIFEDWPFRPTNLFDEGAFSPDERV